MSRIRLAGISGEFVTVTEETNVIFKTTGRNGLHVAFIHTQDGKLTFTSIHGRGFILSTTLVVYSV